MSRVSHRQVTKTWTEYTLPLPCNWGDLQDLVVMARQAIGEEAAQWDTAAEVVATDEELIVRWEAS